MPNFKVYRGNLHDVRRQIETHMDWVFEGGQSAFQSGFDDSTDSTLSFDDLTRTLTISPVDDSYDIYELGEKYTITSPMSIQIDDLEGLHFIYFTEGALVKTQTFTLEIISEYAFVAAIYWDATNNEAVMVMDERHGRIMDAATHVYLHETAHAQYGGGLALNNMQTDGTGNVAADAQFGVDGGSIWDEDILHTIAANGPPAQIPILYRSGANGDWRKSTITDYPTITTGTGRGAWNEWTGATWQLTEISNNQYGLIHYFATGDIDHPVIGILGQADYTSITAARAGADSEIVDLLFGGLEALTFEFVAVATCIWQSSNSYTNAVMQRLRTVDAEGNDYVDWRQLQITGVGSGGGGSGGVSGDAGNIIIAGTDGGAYWDGDYNDLINAPWTVNGNDIYNNNSGNVGIGTTSPLTNLHVASAGNTAVAITRDGAATGNASIAFRTPDDATTQWWGGLWCSFSTPHVNLWGGSCSLDLIGGDYVFKTSADAERVRITDAGDMGIGTDTPSETLDVAGTLKADELITDVGGGFNLAQNGVSATQGILFCGDNVHIDSPDTTSGVYLNWYGGTNGIYIGNGDQGYGTLRTRNIVVNSGNISGSLGGVRFLERADHPTTPAATYGEIWVKNTTPNTLMFTDDAGTDHDLTAGASVAFNDLTSKTGGTGDYRTSGEFQCNSADAFRQVSGGWGTFWRQDASNLYLMATLNSDEYGTWSTMRPFIYSFSTGAVSLGYGTSTKLRTISTGVEVEGAATIDHGTAYPSTNLSFTGIVEKFVAGGTVTAGYAVAINADGSRGEVVHADADLANPLMGVAINGGGAGTVISVLTKGFIKLTGSQFSGSAGNTIAVSTIAGYMRNSSTALSTNDYQWIVGYCPATDVLYVSPTMNWVQNA